MLNLKKLRTEHGLSQQALAEKFNLSQQSIYKYENDLAEPDIKTLKNLAVFFNTTIDYLVGIPPEEQPTPSIDSLYLTKEEISVIKKFRHLSKDSQHAIITIIDNLPKK